MSEFKAAYTKVVAINPHPNPEVHSLAVATIYGFQVIIRKDSLNVGDLVLFAPVDSIIPTVLEIMLFPPDSKIKLNNSRVRQIRIQKFPSQGMILNMKDIQAYLTCLGYKNFMFEEEKDYAQLLGITKYEPEAPKVFLGTKITSKRRLAEHPMMHSYNGVDNGKWFPNRFKEDIDEVVIQNKFHGTNARFGHFKTIKRGIIDNIKSFFGLLPNTHFRYGSNNVDITGKSGKYDGYYEIDLYGRAFEKCKAKDKVKLNELIFGEIIGEGIQKGYHYGHKDPVFILFDVKVFNDDGTFKWLNPEEVEEYAKERGFDMVTILYKGVYKKSVVDLLTVGSDPYYPQHKIKEGIVIKSRYNYTNTEYSSSKNVLKSINPDYLADYTNTDNH